MANLTFQQVIGGLETLQQRTANNPQTSRQITQPSDLSAYLEGVLKSELKDLYMF